MKETDVWQAWQEPSEPSRSPPKSDPDDIGHEERRHWFQAMSRVLNLHQNIEDVLDNDKLTAYDALARIRRINTEIGDIVSDYLPE